MASRRVARAAGARRPSCSPPGYWADVVAEAERGLLDFVTIEDGLSLQSSRDGGRTPAPTRYAGAWTRC